MKKTLLFLLPALLLTGCFFESYREPVRYDLNCAIPTPAVRVRADEFNDRSGAERRIRYREADGRILTDPAMLWSRTPGELIPAALNAAFAGAAPQAPVRKITGTLDRFEADMATRTLILAGSYRFRDGGAESFFNLRVPLQTTTPTGIAEAASQAVTELAIMIQKQSMQPEPTAKP